MLEAEGSVKAPTMAEPTEAGSLPMGSEKVQMMAETEDSEIQPKVSLRRFEP
jgi:hypothetical protein